MNYNTRIEVEVKKLSKVRTLLRHLSGVQTTPPLNMAILNSSSIFLPNIPLNRPLSSL